MNINKKIILASVGAALLLMLVFAVVMLYRGIRQFGVAEQNLANTRTQLNTFYKKDPFPDGKNVAVVTNNTGLMKGWVRDIVDVAKRKQVDPAETKSPSVFINMLAKIRNGLYSRAKQNGTVIGSEDFGFGFDSYVRGDPATADYVPRLIQQLLIVNEICNILIDEKVKEIHSVRREEFEGVRQQAAVQGVKGPARPGGSTARGSAQLSLRRASTIEPGQPNTAAGDFEENAIAAKIRFTFEFSAKEASIINILNRLAQNEMFIVVTALDVETADAAQPGSAAETKSADEAQVKSPLAALLLGGGSSEGVQSAEAETTVKAPPKRVPSREERVVYGGKKEQPAKVHLELEVYRFK
jgi:hypothetical protein